MGAARVYKSRIIGIITGLIFFALTKIFQTIVISIYGASGVQEYLSNSCVRRT